MKRVFLVIGFLFVSAVARADSYQDQYETWRTTLAVSPSGVQVMVATGVIYVDEVIVSSGSGGFSSFILFNASGTAAGQTTTTMTHTTDSSSTGDIFPIKRSFTRGFGYFTTGTSLLDIKWQYPYAVPNGKENLGY